MTNRPTADTDLRLAWSNYMKKGCTQSSSPAACTQSSSPAACQSSELAALLLQEEAATRERLMQMRREAEAETDARFLEEQAALERRRELERARRELDQAAAERTALKRMVEDPAHHIVSPGGARSAEEEDPALAEAAAAAAAELSRVQLARSRAKLAAAAERANRRV